MGSALTFFRSSIRPSLIIIMALVIGGLGQLAMIWPNSFTLMEPMRMAVASASFAEGGLLVALASFCHEEYGTDYFAIIFGTMMTFGAVGLFAYDEIFFPNIYQWYAEETTGHTAFKGYGEWNQFLFTVLAAGYLICFFLAVVSHMSIVRREKEEGSKLVMVKF